MKILGIRFPAFGLILMREKEQGQKQKKNAEEEGFIPLSFLLIENTRVDMGRRAVGK